MNTQKYVLFLSITTTVSLFSKILPRDTCPFLLSLATEICEGKKTISYRVPSIVIY